MAASAGTVVLNLDANSVKMIRELQKAQRTTKKSAYRMRRDMTDAFKKMGIAAAAMGVAVAAAVKSSVAMGDKIGKTSKAVGLSAEAFQEFEFAAGRAGVAASQFGSNMTAFVKRVGEAQSNMGPLVSGLKNLDPVLLENIKNSQNQEDAFRMVADAIAKSDSATKRAAIANAAFSRSGVAMVNMLGDGAKGLDDMAQEARDLGVIMSDEMVRGAEDAADKFGDLQKALQVGIADATLENIDSIVSLTNALIKFAGWTGKAVKGYNLFLASRGVGVKSQEEIEVRAQALIKERAAVEDAIRSYEEFANESELQGGRIGRGYQIQLQRIKEIKAEQVELIRLMRGEAPGGDKPTKDSITKPRALINNTTTRAEADKAVKIIQKMMDEIKTFGMSDDDTSLVALMSAGATEDQIAQFRLIQDELRNLKRIQIETDSAAERRNELAERYKSLVDETRTPMEAHGETLMGIKELWDEGIITSAQEYYDLLGRVNDEFVQQQEDASKSVNEISSTIQSSATSAFTSLITGTQSASEAFGSMTKSILADIARMIIQTLILRSISSMFGGGTVESGASGGMHTQGMFAEGGNFFKGDPIIVGERGPELIVPRTAGTVIPNHDLGGGGGVTVNIDARESDDPGRLLALVPVIQQQIESSIALKQRRGYM